MVLSDEEYGVGAYGEGPFGGIIPMSLRDWLAGQALTGLLAATTAGTPAEVADLSFEYADAVLVARIE